MRMHTTRDLLSFNVLLRPTREANESQPSRTLRSQQLTEEKGPNNKTHTHGKCPEGKHTHAHRRGDAQTATPSSSGPNESKENERTYDCPFAPPPTLVIHLLLSPPFLKREKGKKSIQKWGRIICSRGRYCPLHCCRLLRYFKIENLFSNFKKSTSLLLNFDEEKEEGRASRSCY